VIGLAIMKPLKLTTSELPACQGAVLLVDDDGALRETAAEVLRLAGFEVSTAENGAEALQFLAGASVGVILLDLRMPVLDGWGFLRHRADSAALSAIPVIIVSAEPMDPALATSTDLWLSKPFDEATLIDIVATAFSRGRGQERARPADAEASGLEAGRWLASGARRRA
jgi:CheY-like chemotaxis protein